MDSARPIAACIAGEYDLDTGFTFTAATGRINAGNTLGRAAVDDSPGGYRHQHRRPYGEGPLA
jgi:hypothetical protein